MNLEPTVELCKKFEGFYPKPYLCPANVWTIGYGTTYYPDGRRVTKDDPSVSKEYAEFLLMHEINKVALPGALRFCPNLALHPGALNAAVDFCYNLGVGRLQTSTLRRKFLAEDWDGAKQELMKWVRGGGKVLLGLVRRREAECALF